MENSEDDKNIMNLIRRKDGSPMTEDDEQVLLPYASILNVFSELLTSDDATSAFDKVQRKDHMPMTEDDDAALLPYGGLVLLFNMMLPSSDEDDFDTYSEEDLFSEFECVQRRDGSPMTEDDEAALLPYSGMISVFSILSGLPGDLDASPTGHFEDDEGSDSDPFANIVRKDGTPFTSEDSNMLMKFGGLIHAFKALSAIYELAQDSCDPFEEVKRLDGRELDAEDDAALMEFYPAFKFVSTAYARLCTPLAIVFYPDGDEDFAEFGAKLGETLSEHHDDSIDMNYSAWSLVGNLFLGVYQRAVGSLNSPWEINNSNSQNTGLKRKPSGAELSAWIGLATQKTFGLDDPQRKVRARAVL